MRLNLVGVPEDKEVTHNMGISSILGELKPEMTVRPVGQRDLETEIPLDNDSPKSSSLSFRTSDDKQFCA
jgi:hypothetical protein